MDSNYTSPDLNTKNRDEKTSNYGIEINVQDDEKDIEKTSPKLHVIINKLRDIKYGVSFEQLTKLDLTSSGIDVEKARVSSSVRYKITDFISLPYK